MKEAAGEANMTVVTIVLIGAVAAIATPIITNMIRGMEKRSCCQNYGGTYEGGACYTVKSDGTQGAKISDSKWWDATNKTCK